MKTTVTVTQGQARFPGVVRDAEEGGVVTITRHDAPVAYVIGRERMQAIVETMEIMSNPEAMKAIRDYRSGNTKFQRLSALE
ncbi:MAG: type II toxin-antitoxin system Phd/YefM family antitoxin [Opitutaceae bacterium]